MSVKNKFCCSSSCLRWFRSYVGYIYTLPQAMLCFPDERCVGAFIVWTTFLIKYSQMLFFSLTFLLFTFISMPLFSGTDTVLWTSKKKNIELNPGAVFCCIPEELITGYMSTTTTMKTKKEGHNNWDFLDWTILEPRLK